MISSVSLSTTPRVLLKVYLASDHISDATLKTVAVTISKNGAAFGNPSAGATNAVEIGNGWYYVDLSTTDTGTLGPLIVRGTAAACDNSEQSFPITAATPAASDIATAIFTDLTSGSDFSTASSFGKLVKDNLNAAITSRMATFTVPTNFSTLAITAAGGVTLGDGVAHGGNPVSSTATFAMDHMAIYRHSLGNIIQVGSSASGSPCLYMVNGDTGVTLGGAAAGIEIYGGASVPAILINGPYTTPGPWIVIADGGAGGVPLSMPLMPPSGPATDFMTAFTQLFYRFFPPGASGQVVKDATAHTIVTKDAAGATVTTQTYSDDGLGNETILHAT